MTVQKEPGSGKTTANPTAGQALYGKSRMWITEPLKPWADLPDRERIEWEHVAAVAKEFLHVA